MNAMKTNPSGSQFEAPDWLAALTLSERAALCSNGSRPKSGGRKEGFDQKLAEKRLERWQSQPPFNDGSYFARRLEAAQITRDDFLRTLGEPLASISRRVAETPGWLSEVAAAFADRPQAKETTVPEPGTPTQPKGFGIAAVPLIERGRKRLREGITALRREFRELPFNPDDIEQLLLMNLPGHLLGIYGRTMVLELNVARLRGILEGDTPEARFKDFIRKLRQPDFTIPLLQEYPVLARLMTSAIDNWVRFSLEFLSHLCTDWSTIRSALTPDVDPGKLIGISGGAGDTHRGGRSVVIAFFESGFKVVYKPHSLRVDIHFNQLLRWLNERGDHPPFRVTNVIDRGDHGWVEFVPATACSSPAEVHRFYERQGGYLALLYALEATDFHLENLIASGEHPVLIDLEALFHPRNEPTDAPRDFLMPARRLMAHSVLRIGLLPQRMWAKEDSDGIDMSGLGGEEGQLSPHRLLTWEKIATDEMHAVRKRLEVSGSQNRPKLEGTEIKAARYVDEIVAGFQSVYRLLIKHRAELLMKGGPLRLFRDDEVRAVLRPTRVYALLLGESYHPDVLRDALERDRLLDRLWVGIEGASYMATVIPAEQADLRKGDIPVFCSRPGSRSVWTSAHEEISDFFDEPSLAVVRRRIQGLSEEDMARQSWFIRASMTTLTMGLGFEAPEPEPAPDRALPTPDREQLITEARAIADRLEMLALRANDQVSWIGVTLVNERNWTLLPMGGELYSGTNGLALFFAYVGAVSGEARYTKLAKTIIGNTRTHIEGAREQLAANPEMTGSIGGYTGWGCLIYSLTHLSILLDNRSLLKDAETVADLLPTLIEKDKAFDLLSGVAGCIAALVALYRCNRSERVLAVAIQGGDHLLAHAEKAGPGVGWPSEMATTQLMTGLSHGASGIGLALLELFDVTGEERFKQCALDAFAYERSVFLPEVGNWPDFRDIALPDAEKDRTNFATMISWCHGAPGIGLARVRALEILKDDPAIRHELQIAMQTTIDHGFGRGHSLCHGDLGNLELLLLAGVRLGDQNANEEVARASARIFDSIKQFGWRCGIPGSVETPGFMTGLAGIGYGLLRLADPQRVPSVLTLEAPPLPAAGVFDRRMPIEITDADLSRTHL